MLSKLTGLGVVIATIVLGVSYWMTPERDRLASKYGIAKENVIIDPKPHGCDFDDAPLGNKHCHYEKVVEPERACPGPDCRVTGVYVSWRKVEE